MKSLLCLTLAAVGLSAAPLLAQDELFGKLDANKDGLIAEDEVEGEAKVKFDRLLRTADKDGDKKLSKEEFAAGLKQPDQPRQPPEDARGPGRRGGAPADGARLDALFDRTDANSDGKISKDEVPERLQERFGQMLERIGADAANKEQFGRFMAFANQQGRPGEGRPGEGRPGEGRPGMFRPPVVAALDTDGDGELSAAEIEGASKALAKLDKNSDGKLSREELGPPGPMGPLGDRRPGDAPPGAGRGRFGEQFQARLKEADKNGDGKLSKDEVEKADLPPFVSENFARMDRNGDGQLDQDELRPPGQRGRGGERGRPDGERRPDAPRRD